MMGKLARTPYVSRPPPMGTASSSSSSSSRISSGFRFRRYSETMLFRTMLFPRRYWRHVALGIAVVSLILLVCADQGLMSVSMRKAQQHLAAGKKRKLSMLSSSSGDRVPDPRLMGLSHDDEGSYRGAIVEGWPPGRNRVMDAYIRKDSDTVVNDISCIVMPASVKILIVVQSAPEMRERRRVNRETWMRQQENYPEVKVLFLFGRSSDSANGSSSVVNEEELSREQETHCDLVQMDFIDHYSNVTLDTVMALKLALTWGWGEKEEELPPKFLMIADDDSYVSIPSLWNRLFVDEKRPLLETDYKLWGKVIGGAAGAVHFPEPDKFSHLQTVPYHSWTYSPSYMYNKPNYPDFLSGCGYVIPFKAVNCLYQASLQLPYYHINDIFLTGFARKMCSMELSNDELRIFPDKTSPDRWTENGVVFHRIVEELKPILDHVLVNQKGRVRECGPGRYCWKQGWIIFCPVGQKCEKVL